MITVYGAEPMWGLPDPSPFVTKTETLLKIAGIPYEKRWANFSKAPKGKVPYINDDGEIIPDSTLIRQHIECKYRVDFDAGLDETTRAMLWAYEKLCEDHLYWLMVQERWADDANFEKGPKRFFDKAPALMRPLVIWMIRRQVRRSLHGQGASRYSAQERRMLVDRTYASISGLLRDREFAGGDKPCGADATLYAFTQGAACPHFEGAGHDLIKQYPVIETYIARMKARCFA